MKRLSKLSPAETLLVLHGTKAPLKELLKVTFMDLLIKKALKTTKANYRPSKYDRVQVITYVVPGRNFLEYKPLLHENFFLNPFWKNITLQIIFRQLVKIGYQNSQSKKHCQELIYRSSTIENCFSKNIIQKIVGGFSLTAEGYHLRGVLQNELDELGKIFPTLVASDKKKALEVLETVKGNIFLLKNMDSEFLKEIDKELSEQVKKNYSESGADSGSGCWGCGSWDSFDHHSHSFDSGCSGGDSGCSSSGCSGCSGCGGGD